MICPKCGSENVQVVSENTGATTNGKVAGKSMGCLWGLGRLCLICCTGGLWLIFGKRHTTHKTKQNTKQKYQTYGLCQNCGNKWKI